LNYFHTIPTITRRMETGDLTEKERKRINKEFGCSLLHLTKEDWEVEEQVKYDNTFL